MRCSQIQINKIKSAFIGLNLIKPASTNEKEFIDFTSPNAGKFGSGGVVIKQCCMPVTLHLTNVIVKKCCVFIVFQFTEF